MKRIILIFCIVPFIFTPILNVQAKNNTTYQKKESAVKTPEIGFYVYLQKERKVYQLKTQSLAEVYTFIQVAFPDFCAELEKEMETSPAFMQITFNSEIYVEKMQITKNGKYKRLKIKTKNIYL